MQVSSRCKVNSLFGFLNGRDYCGLVVDDAVVVGVGMAVKWLISYVETESDNRWMNENELSVRRKIQPVRVIVVARADELNERSCG